MDETTLTLALRDLAANPPLHTAPAADARHRARRLQRRHRLTAAAAVLVVAAGAFGVRDLAGGSRHTTTAASAPAHVVTIRQVTEEAPCDPSGAVPAGELRDFAGEQCYRLAVDALTIHPKSVEALHDSVQGYLIQVDLNDTERVAFGQLTAKVTTLTEPLNQLAIVLDDVVLSAPSIQSAIDGGVFQITGGSAGLTKADVDTLAAELSP